MTHPALKIATEVLAEHDSNGITSVGTSAAIKAMAKFWETHLAEGNDPRLVSLDLDSVIKQLKVMRGEIARRIESEFPAAQEADSDRKKFFKTTYELVVLSEHTPASNMSLADLAYSVGDGPCVGECSDNGGVELTAKQAADALTEMGSEPGYFGLDASGEPSDDDDDEEGKDASRSQG